MKHSLVNEMKELIREEFTVPQDTFVIDSNLFIKPLRYVEEDIGTDLDDFMDIFQIKSEHSFEVLLYKQDYSNCKTLLDVVDTIIPFMSVGY